MEYDLNRNERSLAQRRGRRAVPFPAALITIGLLATACSGGANGPGVARSGSASPTRSETPRPVAYSQCMRSHGVPNFPKPDAQGHILVQGGPGSGLDPQSPQFKAAEEACKSLAPGQGGTTVQPEKPAASGGKPMSAADWRAFGDYLKQRAAAGDFSGAVLVAKDGQPLLERGYGLADRKRGIPNTPKTKFCIASMGKMFTAVAIAQLVEQGKLSFNDTIGKYVSGFPPEIADRVTIAELLTMTSGLGDAALGTPNPPTTFAGLMERIVKEPLQFKPGSRFAYSNDGFIVLGAIIERVSGQSYDQYVREHIFKPAGMTDTDIRAYRPSEIPGMAHGYMVVDQNGRPVLGGPPPGPGQSSGARSGTLRDNGYRLQIGNPSGGAYSTVVDMFKFAQALIEHKLLSPAMTDTLLAGKVNANRPGGPPVDKYGYGFADEEINGVRIVGHNGGTPGYEGELDIYPDRGYVVVILTNQDQVLVPAIRRSEDLLTH